MRSIVRPLLAVLCLATAAFAADEPATTTPAETKKEPAAMEFVLMSTTKGDIVLELNAEKAPITVANFLSYVDDKHYDGTIFHRVMVDFMIQGGGFTPDMKEKSTKDPIKNEWDNTLKNTRGTIAMARTGNPDSATAQFFINVADNSHSLSVSRPDAGNAGYAVFGRVAVGMDVVDAIRVVPVRPNQISNAYPNEQIVINSAVRIDATKAAELVAAEAEKAKSSAE
jgi:cyclophilin family peptidyl-prolyl cis-trans isomerase